MKVKKSTFRQFKPKARSIPVGLYSMEVERLSDDGKGIARPKGKTTFIAGALPGETVKVRYVQCRKDFDQAELVSVEKASSTRRRPICPHYGECGGCHLQHVEYAVQLEHKSSQLKHLLNGLSQEKAIDWFPDIQADEVAYRHRIRLAIKAGKKGFSFGFRKGQSKQIVDITRCDVVFPGINQCLALLRGLLPKLKNRSSLLECIIGEAEQGKRFSVSLVSCHPLCEVDISCLVKLAKAQGWCMQLLLEGRLDSPYWQSSDAHMAYKLPKEGLSIYYDALDFTQVNPAVNRQMVERAIQWLDLHHKDHVADFFSGVGNFSLSIAKYVASVTAFELVPGMLQKVLKNAEVNGINNIEVNQANLFSGGLIMDSKFNKVLLDPPRSGALALSQSLSTETIQKIVYVSCNPQSLMRDLQQLIAKGFYVERACLIDMFPQTRHSEAMVLLSCD